MDLVRTHLHRGVGFDQIVIELGAALHCDKADAIARNRQILVLQEIAKAGIGRDDPHLDRRCIIGAQPRLVCRADPLWEGLDGPVIRRSFNALCKLEVELVDDIVDDQLGLDDAGLHAFAEAANGAVEQNDEFAVTFQVVIIVDKRLERRCALSRSEIGVEGMEPKEMVDRANSSQRQHVGLKSAQGNIGLPFEDVIGNLVSGIERRAINGLEALEIRFARLALRREIGVSHIIAQPVSIAQIATEQRVDRVPLEAGLVTVEKKLLELRCWRRFLGGGCLNRNRERNRGKAGK